MRELKIQLLRIKNIETNPVFPNLSKKTPFLGLPAFSASAFFLVSKDVFHNTAWKLISFKVSGVYWVKISAIKLVNRSQDFWDIQTILFLAIQKSYVPGYTILETFVSFFA